ncbi:hypothetical protein V6N11_070807 [Hibiscus sabdariffa]|uniref:Uncharacterized protein n=1 Tax=Hibiscus sabdariffa TaxID=183260 RepID=A0ABR2QG43_9ROSI
MKIWSTGKCLSVALRQDSSKIQGTQKRTRTQVFTQAMEGEDKTKNKVIIPAIQLCQVGFSNGTYPDMEDNFLILWSQSRKTSDLDKSNFTKMFKNLVTIDLKIPRVIKVEICLSLQQQIPDKHVCQICLDEASTDAPLSSDKTKM